MLLTAALLFALLNALAWAILASRDAIKGTRNPIEGKYGKEYASAYPDLSRADLEQLLDETWSRHVAFQPFVHYGEQPFHGKFVNVDEAGFRRSKDQAPWPPSRDDYVVFVLGGSTAFGYGVSDEQTIASCLQEELGSVRGRRARVYNFGQGGYYSSQERVQLERLLLHGRAPDAVVFVDGLNEFFYRADLPEFSQRYATIVDMTPSQLAARSFAEALPVTKLFHWARRPAPFPVDPARDEKDARDVIDRYVANKTMIEGVAKAWSVRTVFAWQPAPMYRFDLAKHPFAVHGFGSHALCERGYPMMEESVRAHPLGDDFLWCADLHEGASELLYVDAIHYSPAMCRRIARAIAKLGTERKLF